MRAEQTSNWSQTPLRQAQGKLYRALASAQISSTSQMFHRRRTRIPIKRAEDLDATS
jgi:hypothetical protein